jgi:hypothetical protein
MSAVAWSACAVWIAAAVVVAALRGMRAARSGRARGALRRLKSPSIYLFAAYVLVAAFVAPLSAGESTSPLVWLAPALLLTYAGGTFAAAADERPSPLVRVALAGLFAGAFAACAAVILALASPAFVPGWLR